MINRAIVDWRKNWKYQRQKHGLGPVDDIAWADYVNSLSMAEVLDKLSVHGDIVEHITEVTRLAH